MDEVGVDEGTGKVRVQVDPKYYRPTEVVSSLSILYTSTFRLTLWDFDLESALPE